MNKNLAGTFRLTSIIAGMISFMCFYYSFVLGGVIEYSINGILVAGVAGGSFSLMLRSSFNHSILSCLGDEEERVKEVEKKNSEDSLGERLL